MGGLGLWLVGGLGSVVLVVFSCMLVVRMLCCQSFENGLSLRVV